MVGAGVHLLRRKNKAFTILCTCSCHRSCPVGDRREVPGGEWLTGCTCGGSGDLKEIELRARQESDARKARSAEVLRDVDFGRRRSASEIQREILSAYEARGYEPRTDFSRLSRFIAAGTGRRGTRTVRSLVETARALRAATKWVADTSKEHPNPDEASFNAKDRPTIRRAFAMYTGLAAGAAAGAFFTNGMARAILVLLAFLLVAVAAWVGLWALVIGVLSRISRGRPGDPVGS